MAKKTKFRNPDKFEQDFTRPRKRKDAKAILERCLKISVGFKNKGGTIHSILQAVSRSSWFKRRFESEWIGNQMFNNPNCSSTWGEADEQKVIWSSKSYRMQLNLMRRYLKYVESFDAKA